MKLLAIGLLLLSLAPAAARAAAHAESVGVKGFVVDRRGPDLTVRSGDGAAVVVRLAPGTEVAGLRTAAAEIALLDLVRVEGLRGAGGVVLARRVDVVMAGDGFRRGRAEERSLFWRWVLNGAFSVPLP
ncbi:MAG TPA: hypothetical protein VNN19_07520 [bacterium]|nr:hypothetical protein [bacterium]